MIHTQEKQQTSGSLILPPSTPQEHLCKKPVSFTATGAQPIPALSGTNTLLTDADSVSVSGRADLIRIVRKMQEK